MATNTIEWTQQDSIAAQAEGWGIFFCYGKTEGYQLHRLDEQPAEEGSPFYEQEEDAWLFVYKQFLVGDKLAKKALMFLSENNPEEFQLIKQHGESTVTKSGLYNPV